MSKHTPGPWVVRQTRSDRTRIESAPVAGVNPAVPVGHVADVYDPSYQSRGEANARLIAAAPDLLEVLRDLEDPESGCRLSKHALASIREAIAKAEGAVPSCGVCRAPLRKGRDGSQIADGDTCHSCRLDRGW